MIIHPEAPVLVGVTHAELRRLRTFTFRPDSLDIAPDDRRCAVCLADFEGGACVRELLCKHYFPKGCVDKCVQA